MAVSAISSGFTAGGPSFSAKRTTTSRLRQVSWLTGVGGADSLPIPDTEQWVPVGAPRLQWRYRGGFSPPSLFFLPEEDT